MTRIVAGLRYLAVTLMLILLVGCAKEPPLPTPTKIDLTIRTTEYANPDLSGRPSPVVVVVFALKPGNSFETATARALTSLAEPPDPATMPRIGRYAIRPDSSKKLSFEAANGVEKVGVVAGFRDTATTIWRASIEVKQEETNTITATIGAKQVQLRKISFW